MSKTSTERRLHFDAIVEKAEADFNHNPKSYKTKLKWLALLGYGYLSLILLLCLVFFGFLVFMSIKSPVFLLMLIKTKIIVAVAVIMYVMFKSLFIKIPAPEGVRIDRQQAPELHAAINAMQKQLRTPKIHEIVITPELNAAIQQTPRLGIFGWQKNSLILGTELLLSMNHDQAMAVIAHEMGHLSGGHSKFNGWIYRVRMSWMNILYTVGQINAVARWVFGKFFAWYAPYFNAYSFALARANEYEADQISAQITSADKLSSALIGTQVVADVFFEDYWRKLEKKAFENAKLSNDSYKQVQTELSEFNFDSKLIERAMNKALKVKTTNDNTHPALKDRIAAVEGKPTFCFKPEHSAAKHWFGDQLAEIMDQVASNWVMWNKSHWQDLHEQGKEAKRRLSDLNNKTDLSVPELVEKGQIQLFLQGKRTALSTFKEVLKLNNNEPNALFHLGTALLEKDNEKGLLLLHKLMKHDDFVNAAGQHLYAYYDENDRHEQADEVLLKIEQQSDKEDALYEEITNTTINDEFNVVDISTEDQEKLKMSIKKYKGIKHVWLAGKKLTTKPDAPMYIILFELHHDEEESEVFAEHQHHIELAGYFTMINTDNKKITKKIKPHCKQIY